MPAFFNGVFGHKPSGGLIPGTGQHPVAAGVALQYLTTGPLCRRAEDLPLLVSLMMGPDHQDEGCEEFPSLQNLQEKVKQVDLSTLKVYWIDQIPAAGLSGVESSLNQALHRALSELAKLQCPVTQVQLNHSLKDLKYAPDIWSSMLYKGNPYSFAYHMGEGKPFYAMWELMKWIVLGSSHYTLPALLLCVLERAPGLTPRRTERMVEKGERLREELEALLGDDGVLLCPPHPKVAPRHMIALFRPFNWIYTAIWNVMLAPVTQVPMGLSPIERVPVGVQVIAKRGNDHLTLAVAQHLEKVVGGWVAPQHASEQTNE